jgi:hypothetical protein
MPMEVSAHEEKRNSIFGLIQHSSTIIIASCGTAITLCKTFNFQKYHHNIDY